MPHPFELFLETFIPQVARKTRQVRKAAWLLATSGEKDAADLQAELSAELRGFYSDKKTFEDLKKWQNSGEIKDPLLLRQLNILLRSFKGNILPIDLLEKICQKEAELNQIYGQFRAQSEGVELSENAILEILKRENNPSKRLKAWQASKEIGKTLAPHILELVQWRNESAKISGYDNFFQMQLALQEVDDIWLEKTLEEVASASDSAYQATLVEINSKLALRFAVSVDELGPWSWADPFCQADPLDNESLDGLVEDLKLVDVCTKFYQEMGFDVVKILERSDLFERMGKNQHAFCTHIDRSGDIRTLNNLQPTLKWLDTLLHELGHGVYEIGLNSKLPWLLRAPPHMIPTEAMALIAGRQAYKEPFLKIFLKKQLQEKPHLLTLIGQATKKLKRSQLIFSRWVLVMTHFERELYRNPNQDLNELWWYCVEKYQGMKRPTHREGCQDWAAKYHMGLAPVYYFSYLLGELLASQLEEMLEKELGSPEISSTKAGEKLKEHLFKPGASLSWSELSKLATGQPLSAKAWLKQFGS
jgi:peptidyl-dipeptidase A